MTERIGKRQETVLRVPEETEELKFVSHWVPARKDLLHFVEEVLTSKVYEGLGEDPQRWIEELYIISTILTGEGLVAGIDINSPPEGDPEFQRLGDGVFLYRGRGKIRRLRGVWTSKETTRYDFEKRKELPHTQWTHYQMDSHATLKIKEEFADLNPEIFLPENFEPRSTVVKEDKRPILTFRVQGGGEPVTVFAKGAFVGTSHLYEPPSYRLTNLARITKTNSKIEMNRFLALAQQGVRVPTVLGYYEAPVEEFLFLQKVNGKNPLEFLESHRKAIIEQDAQMLASLCLLGYRKAGFEDFEDKIFDEQYLYLIDVDELDDLYYPFKLNYREMLLDPSNTKALDEFRDLQRLVFRRLLKDTIFRYKESLALTFEHQSLYITSFFQRVGWGQPTEEEIRELTKFTDNYITWGSSLAMMSEE